MRKLLVSIALCAILGSANAQVIRVLPNGDVRFDAGYGLLGGDIIIGTYAYTTNSGGTTYPLTFYYPAIYSNQDLWGLYLGTPDNWAWRTYSYVVEAHTVNVVSDNDCDRL